MATSIRRQRRSRAQWRSLIARARRSPLSIAAFCRAEGVSTASFYAWRKRIASWAPPGAAVVDCERASSEPAAAVVVPGPGEAAPFLDLGTLADTRPEAGRWDLELALGAGVVLRLRRV